MVNSMTGFAASEGTFADTRFSWDIRSVNAKPLRHFSFEDPLTQRYTEPAHLGGDYIGHGGGCTNRDSASRRI